jgi:hypothetical protein
MRDAIVRRSNMRDLVRGRRPTPGPVHDRSTGTLHEREENCVIASGELARGGRDSISEPSHCNPAGERILPGKA